MVNVRLLTFVWMVRATIPPMNHRLAATRENLHGHFSRDLKPVLRIEQGDTVTFQCLDAGWGLEPHNGVDIHRKEIPNRDPGLDDGHALTGPIWVNGSMPGQTLKVQIESLELGEWGTTMIGGWPSDWNRKLGIESEGIFFVWTYADGRATNQFGHSVPVAPFMGIYGMPTNEPDVLSTIPPRRTGGNLDCKELVAGSILYLPIEVEGALFSTGDGHAAQGDGEVCVTAIETPMDQVQLTFDIVDDMPIKSPVANTPKGWLAMGFGETLDDAMTSAIDSMTHLMGLLFGLDYLKALGLCSVGVDFRVTQVVNGVVGVHAVLPHGKIAFDTNSPRG